MEKGKDIAMKKLWIPVCVLIIAGVLLFTAADGEEAQT